jgi:hypothetical protein
MELWEAIEQYTGRNVDFLNEVILRDDNGIISIEWNITDILQPTQEVLNELQLQVSHTYKERKIAELEAKMEEEILVGFYSSAKKDINGNGVEKFYPFAKSDQDMMTGQLTLIAAGSNLPIYWKALNEPLAYAFTKEEFLKLCEDGAISRQTKMIKFQQLRYLVYQAKTEAEIDVINW